MVRASARSIFTWFWSVLPMVACESLTESAVSQDIIKYSIGSIFIMDSSNKKRAGALLFVGGSQFTVGMIIAEAIYQDYSVSENYISDLGVWGNRARAILLVSCII